MATIIKEIHTFVFASVLNHRKFFSTTFDVSPNLSHCGLLERVSSPDLYISLSGLRARGQNVSASLLASYRPHRRWKVPLNQLCFCLRANCILLFVSAISLFLVQSFFETLQYCDEGRKFNRVIQSVIHTYSHTHIHTVIL